MAETPLLARTQGRNVDRSLVSFDGNWPNSFLLQIRSMGSGPTRLCQPGCTTVPVPSNAPGGALSPRVGHGTARSTGSRDPGMRQKGLEAAGAAEWQHHLREAGKGDQRKNWTGRRNILTRSTPSSSCMSVSQAKLPQGIVGGRWLDFLRFTHVVLEVVVSCRGTSWLSRSRRFSSRLECSVVLGLWTRLRLKAVSHFARHGDCSCCDTGCLLHNEISVERKTLGIKALTGMVSSRNLALLGVVTVHQLETSSHCPGMSR